MAKIQINCSIMVAMILAILLICTSVLTFASPQLDDSNPLDEHMDMQEFQGSSSEPECQAVFQVCPGEGSYECCEGFDCVDLKKLTGLPLIGVGICLPPF
ncbi:unnamed protein product [Amaranthus hypochondriacus]